MEGLCKELGRRIVVSAQTRERLVSADGLDELPAVKVRGKEEPVKVFAVS